MSHEWKPGNLSSTSNDYSQFINSMASTIEQELNDLMVMDGLPALSMDSSDESIRDRRRLFVAIARGVVKHLVDNKNAVDIRLSDNTVVHPETIRTEGL